MSFRCDAGPQNRELRSFSSNGPVDKHPRSSQLSAARAVDDSHQAVQSVVSRRSRRFPVATSAARRRLRCRAPIILTVDFAAKAMPTAPPAHGQALRYFALRRDIARRMADVVRAVAVQGFQVFFEEDAPLGQYHESASAQ